MSNNEIKIKKPTQKSFFSGCVSVYMFVRGWVSQHVDLYIHTYKKYAVVVSASVCEKLPHNS